MNAAFQRVAILNKEGYVSRAVTYSKIDGEDVLEYAAQNSGINQAQLSAAMYAIRQSFVNFLLNGHSVELLGRNGLQRPLDEAAAFQLGRQLVFPEAPGVSGGHDHASDFQSTHALISHLTVVYPLSALQVNRGREFIS